MKSKSLKCLLVCLLVALVACVPGELGHNARPSPSSPTRPPDTAYPSPVQPKTVTPSNSPTLQLTLAPSPTPTLPPSPTLTTTPILRVSQIRMFDANTGWAVQFVHYIPLIKNLKILRTTDGLRTWTDVSPPVPEGDYWSLSASFLDGNNAMAVYVHQLMPTSASVEAITWRTIDGGQTWQAGQTLSSNLGIMEGIDVMMLDAEDGWMLSNGTPAMGHASIRFLVTQDEGLHWEMVYDSVDHISDPYTLWIKGYYPFSKHFVFPSKDVGFFSSGKLVRSQDGGKSWELQSLEPPPDLADIDCTETHCTHLDVASAPRFSSPQDGVLVRRAYLNSEIVGDVFSSYPNTLSRLPLPAAQYLYFTRDGGRTWAPRPAPVVLGMVFFLDADTGWLLGKSDPDPAAPAQLYQTTDGGKTWIQVSAAPPLPLGSEMQFVDPQTGFAFFPSALADFYQDFDARIHTVEKESTLFYTKDGGRSWTEVTPNIAP